MAGKLGRELTSEERRYYLLSKTEFAALAPFYDSAALLLSFGALPRVRDRVVNFTDAQKDSRILDVGTGTGRQAFAFAKRGYDVVGVDLSEDMLKVAKKKNQYGNIRFEVADATALPFEDDNFDASCASFALHDMIPSVREKALREMARVTKPEGTIVIVDYGLPKNRVSRFFIYHIVKLWEPLYPGFIRTDLAALLRTSGIEVREEMSVLFGAGRILKGIKR